jgi:hypothetical protein
MPRKKVDIQVTNTLDEIAIPKGSPANYDIYRRVEYHNCISIIIPLASGMAGEFIMSREDAVALGIIPNDFEKPGKHPHKPEKDEKEPDDEPEESDIPETDLPEKSPEGFA